MALTCAERCRYASIATGLFLTGLGTLFIGAICCAKGPIPHTQLMLSIIALAMGVVTVGCLSWSLATNPK